MNKYLCIHGHFYQPPRENPWLNEVEMQESAYPYHDWNERITAECYARNSASRILDEEKRIIDIVNNYSFISFNFGPTLLEWMQKKAPQTYQAILQADKDSQQRFGGHGSAIAQAYNHIILPLATRRDIETQVIWGIKDFEKRFKRKPEGMWCGETAVNTEVLEVLAEQGIKFTILSPFQASRIRKSAGTEWEDVSGGKIQPNQPYVCKLPSGKSISLFFYNAQVSQAVAFEGLLNNGENFANRLTGGFSENEDAELMNIATDGESYGHHHRLGEMGLSYAIYYIQNKKLANLTIYGQYLELYPPEMEVEIIENSSWSCSHGVERWRSNCGCNTGGHPEWNQKWRGPLRGTFDWLRGVTEKIYEAEMANFTQDAWEIRNKYIDVISDRSEANIHAFLDANFGGDLTGETKVRILKLLEMQFNSLLMFTSCGWFFDEVTGIEPMQDILYATRALQLASELSGKDYEATFIHHLSQAKSNETQYANAAEAYQSTAKDTMLDMLRVGAHYAISSIFNNYPAETNIYSYKAKTISHEEVKGGQQKLGIGIVTLKSELTWETATIKYAVLHLGDHQIFAGVDFALPGEDFQQVKDQIFECFKRSHTLEIVYILDKHFGSHSFSFWHLFRDEQHKILKAVLQNSLTGITAMFEKLYETNFPILQALKEVNMPFPSELNTVNNFVINNKLKALFSEPEPDRQAFAEVIKNVNRFKPSLDVVSLNYSASESIYRQMQNLQAQPENEYLMAEITEQLSLIKELKLEPDLWASRNMAFAMYQQYYNSGLNRHGNGANFSASWNQQFKDLYESLNLKA